MKESKKSVPYIVLLFLVLLGTLLCSLFCFQLTLVQGESMEPSYHNAQFVIINKLDKSYAPGDCILFYCERLGCKLVKRIVALPGDRVQIDNGSLFINGKAFDPYPGSPGIDFAGLAEEELSIPEGHCFVLGDNFSFSIDSRREEVGLVPLKEIEGTII